MFPPNFLTSDRISCQQELTSKKAIFQHLAALLASNTANLDSKSVFLQLLERERLGNTGLGMGIALPHARMAGVAGPIGALIQLKTGVAFEAVDESPVDLVFGLLVPVDAREEHLQLLARIAGLFSQPHFCMELRNARSPDQMLRLMEGWETLSLRAAGSR